MSLFYFTCQKYNNLNSLSLKQLFVQPTSFGTNVKAPRNDVLPLQPAVVKLHYRKNDCLVWPIVFRLNVKASKNDVCQFQSVKKHNGLNLLL
jgi:hypothetical protein